MLRQFAGMVVVEVAQAGAGFEQATGVVVVLCEGDVQHRDALAGTGVDPLQQGDVTLYAADQVDVRA
ncbi:hypothetical protein D3C78_563130 [compost metagenome]